nr:hypothetical protein [Tanacetum cinerariifolium]
MGYYFYFPPKNKIVIVRFVEFFEKNLITQEVSERAVELEEIQDEDTSPFEITSESPMEVKGFKPPQEEMILIRRSESTHRAPNRLYLNVEVEEHNLRDLNEPASYKAAMLDSESNKDRSKRLIGLGQNAYMDKILKRCKMDNSKRRHIPMQERLDLNKTQGASTLKVVKCMQKVSYALAVGFIMYGGVADLVNKGGHKGFAWGLRVQGGDKEASMVVTRYGGWLLEAEYIAASKATMEAVWIRKSISGLGIVPTINEPIRMFCNNSAALHFANEPRVQRGARHYHRRYHYVRESIALDEIRFLKVHTDDNLADLFTKGLSKGKLTQHARSMGLRLASVSCKFVFSIWIRDF